MAKRNRIPHVFSKEQLIALVDQVTEPDLMIGVAIGIFCGLRISEIMRLRKEDINLHSKQLIVRDGKMPGKKELGYGKDRVVPMPSVLVNPLRKWMRCTNNEWLFPSISCQGKHITSEYFERKYWKALERAGLRIFWKLDARGRKKHKYNFHTLRHTYATLLWEKTGDIYAVKAALGHFDIDTTMVYTHVSDKALQNKVEAAFDPARTIELKPALPQIQTIHVQTRRENPLSLLKLRLAKGEISTDEYAKLTATLRPQRAYLEL